MIAKKYENALINNGHLGVHKNKVAELMIQSLGEEVPYTMALAMANFTMASFTGHFHYKIFLKDDNLVPMNVIIFVLAKSGAQKTSSVGKLEKAIAPGLDVIQMVRKQRNEQRAKDADIPVPKLMPLSNALSTVPGLLANLNSFKEEGLGLPSMVVDEVATAIAVNPDFIPNVEVVAQLFDSGDCKVKVLKDKENQSDEVNGMGMTALFVGSEKAILDDNSVLKAFETEFVSKLARRCFFVYPNIEKKINEDIDEDDIFQLAKQKVTFSDEGEALINHIKEISSKVAAKIIHRNSDFNILKVSEDAIVLWKVYEEWCKHRAAIIPDEEEPRLLEQQHRHWKAFKLAGTYAVWDMSDSMEVEHLRQAIYAAELTAGDLNKFINMAKREPYEVILDLFHRINDRVFTLHELIKLKVVKSEAQVDSLVRNANSKLGGESHIEYVQGKLTYHKHKVVDDNYDHWASYKKVSSVRELTDKGIENGLDYSLAKRVAKETVAKEAQNDYMSKQSKWDKLANLLCKSVAYVPFKLKTIQEGASFSEFTKDANGGIRRKDNISSPATWIVFDIDETDISIHEMIDNLQEYTYHMALGSDPDNIYKYRIIMPLSIEVNLDSTRYKKFVQQCAIGVGIDIKIDDLPQSQFYYGYEGNAVYSNVGEKIDAAAAIAAMPTPKSTAQSLSKQGRDSTWADREYSYQYFYKVESGQGLHNGLFRVMAQMVDYGYSADDIKVMIETMIEETKNYPRPNFLEGSLWPQMYERLGEDKYGIKYED